MASSKVIILTICLSFVFVFSGKACPIDDPLIVPETLVNITLSPLIFIDHGSTQGGGVILGMSTLTTDAPFNLLTMTLTFNLTLQHATLAGVNHSASGTIDAGPFLPEIIPTGPFTAIGNSSGSVSNFVVTGKAVLFVNLINLQLSVRTLQIDNFSFGEFTLDLGNVVVGGVPMNWAVWNAGIKTNWERNWAENKLGMVEHVRVSANTKLKELTLQDFLDFILRPC